ncbi:MFS transporter [Enterovirga rhinocerotis]|uniref:Nitrate/nitrite transporter NarK n=1 Tax=Enterovirga rhinocerotis TaxID=1339210 RepID=A0A4R7BWL0_9HYPH|nr:MFS transporter [Enterovirga rhinocerotis]TDR89562.1 nitrate/nitrite transporter NarK [Enterovirga rhinocerotis]
MTSFLVLLFAYTLSQFYRSFLAVVSADMTRDLRLDPAALGTLSAAWFFAFAFAQFPVGYALDRWGPRRMLALAMLAAVGGALWLALASGFTDAVIAMVLIGIGCSPIYMSSLYIVARTRPHQFAFLSSAILGIGSIGNLLGATPLVLAAERFGWRGSLMGIAALTLASAVSVWLLVRDPPPAERTGGDSLLGGLKTILSIRVIWLLVPLALVSYAVVIATRSVWIAPYLTSTFGLAPEPLGNAVLAMALAMSLGAIISGALERWIGAKTTTACGIAIGTCGFLALGLGYARDVWAAVAILTAIGFFGIMYAVLLEHARSFMPAALVGRGITFMNFAFIGGSGLVQWLSGRAVSGWIGEGMAAPEAYQRLFLAFGIALVAALAIYLFAPPRPARAIRPAPAP